MATLQVYCRRYPAGRAGLRACQPGRRSSVACLRLPEKRPLEKFDSARLSRKKKEKQANVVNRRKLLLKGYNFKERKHDRFRKRPAANAAEKIDERSTEADVSAFRRSIGLFVFFLRSSKNFRFAFLALNVSSQSFTWKISICSAKSNHVLRCSLSGELATGACLWTGDRVAASQLQLT